MVGGAEQMRTLSLSSPLPLCNGVVVLDERPPVKGDGLGLSGRLLVNGCGRGGERERERGVIQRMRSRRSMRRRVRLWELEAMECERMEGEGRGRARLSFFN